jgi:hypothetical protein
MRSRGRKLRGRDRELAVLLAEALDREVDARYGRAELDRHATSSALHRARCEGLL